MDGVIASIGVGLAMAFGESGLGLGMVIPGETVVVVLAAGMPAPGASLALAAAVTVGACLGDHVGYLLGRRYGERLRDTALVARVGRHQFDRATDLLRRHGGRAVFLTRLVPIIRTLTPAAAGTANLEYRRFLPASLAGSALWATVYVGGGSAVAAVGHWTHDALGRGAWLALAVVAIVVLPVAVIRAFVAVRPVAAQPEVGRFESQLRIRAHDPLIDLVTR